MYASVGRSVDVCSLSAHRLSRRALSLLPPALHCVQDSMVLGEICFMGLVVHRLPLHWLGCEGGTEGGEIGLISVGKAGAATLCLSVNGD